ncbi:MAG TPA: AI-2E family transporter [Xanthobacteraceae bacterium]|nr:AI-2E family transporter [Xanthobacteraceae bacterium]
MEFLRAHRERRNAQLKDRQGKDSQVKDRQAKDREPLGSIEDIWTPATQMATVGIFVLLLGAFLYFSRPVLLPVVAAVLIGTTLAPIVKAAARHRISPWATAVALGLLLVAAAGTAVTLLANPVSEWIAKAPEIGAAIKQKLYVLDRPLAALQELQEVLMPSAGKTVAVEQSQLAIVTPVISVVTPAVVEITLFFVTLIFFLATQMDFRRYMVSFFTSRDAKLRFFRIANDIEDHLASYVATVTVINFGLGVVVALGAWLFGFPSPLIFGILAMALNYIPYIGAACLTLIILGVGLVTFPSLSFALVPPAAFVAVATIEGQFITPAVLGHRLTLNPLMVLLALAFWAWLWGPIGAFLAVPLTMVGLVTLHHLFPPDESKLPD